jgi:hypothetical protein
MSVTLRLSPKAGSFVAFTAPSKSQKLFLDFRPAAIAPIYLGIDHVDALHIYSPTRRDDNENCGVPSVFI